MFERDEINLNKVNAKIDLGETKSLIKQSEDAYHSLINDAVEEVTKKSAKIILLSGPSSAGKTTTSYLIKKKLIEKGFSSFVVSLDDFLLAENDLPIDENGKKDYETINSLDINQIERSLKDIIYYGKAIVPVFDFIAGKRQTKFVEKELGSNAVVIVEGIHALNPSLINGYDEKYFYRIYVHCNSNFTYDNNVLMEARKLRLIRRIIRDSKFRNCTPLTTITRWDEICVGEDLFTRPYKQTVNFLINSSHPYEMAVYKNYLKGLLKDLKTNFVAQELASKLKYSRSIAEKLVPNGSLLREFIGE